MSELKNKYKRQPNQKPPKKRGNVDIINKLVNDEPINTAKQKTINTEKKKATFVLDAKLHKRLRLFAAENDMTMVDIVEKALNEYLDRVDK